MTVDSTTKHHQESHHHDQTVSTTSSSSSSSSLQRFFKAKYILLAVIVSSICIFLVLGSPSMPKNGYDDNDNDDGDNNDNNLHLHHSRENNKIDSTNQKQQQQNSLHSTKRQILTREIVVTPKPANEINDDVDNFASDKTPTRPPGFLEQQQEMKRQIVLEKQREQQRQQKLVNQQLKEDANNKDDDDDNTKNKNDNNNQPEPPGVQSPDEDIVMGGQFSRKTKNKRKRRKMFLEPFTRRDLYSRYPSLPYVDQYLTQYQATGYRYQPSGIVYRKFIPAEALSLLRIKNSAQDHFSASNNNNKNKNNNKKQLRAPRVATVLVPVDGDVTKLPALSDDEVVGTTFIQMIRIVSAGLGLSTQLMTYIHFIAAAQAARTRVLLFPEALRTTWFSLVNMSATTFPGPPLLYAASRDTIEKAYLIHGSLNTKNFFKWTREKAAEHPNLIKRRLVEFFEKGAMKQLAKIPTMYKRYPFAIEKDINFGKMTCGIVYHSKIEALSMKLLQNMEQRVKDYLSGAGATDTLGFNSFNNINQVLNHKPSSSSVINPPFPWSISESSAKPYLIPAVRYVSLHLRIEYQDSIAFKRPAPKPAQLEAFLRNVVSKVCRRHRTHHVFVASGPLNQSYYDVLKKTNYVVTPGIMMNIFTKEDLIKGDTLAEQMSKDHFFNEEQTEILWNYTKIFPTNTKMAAVDSILLQHGVAAVLTGFSSLTTLVYSRRCYEGPRCLGGLYGTEGKYGGATNYLYEVTAETGKFTNAKPFKCGYRMEELLRGGNAKDPPRQEDYFMENPRPNVEKLFDGE